ncbi:unnamed protein product, partial [Rotaria sp. Silwood2]
MNTFQKLEMLQDLMKSIFDWLQKRSIVTSHGDEESRFLETCVEAPQGSTFAALLFRLHIFFLPSYFSQIVSHLYADDLTLVIKGAVEKKLSENITYLEEQAKSVMKTLEKFADNHILSANTGKKKIILIHSTIAPLSPHVNPLRSSSSTNIHPNARWQQNGITVAGGNRQGNGINQLSYPLGLYVDDDQTVYVADESNHRIVEWKCGATSGQVVAGGNGQGNGAHQLSYPYDVIVDKERDSLIICDRSNRRVVRWPRRNGTSGETIISNIGCWGLTMDENGSLYVTDIGKHEVRRYRRGESQGTVVAGGNGSGNRLDQLTYPTYVFVDRDHSVYVSDGGNHRVMKWVEGAKQGIVVAGGQGQGNGLTQWYYP